MNTEFQPILSQIAKQHLGIESLQPRHSDGLDFHDLAVWSIEAALKAAFEAGRVMGEDAAKNAPSK